MSDETRQQAIEDAMTSPASMATDGTAATARSADDLIKLDDRLANKSTANKSRLPIRYGKFRPSGGGE
jgi:hypothetical protein